MAKWFAKRGFSRNDQHMQDMTSTDLDELARIAAVGVADRLVVHLQEDLGAELLGAYLIGSLSIGETVDAICSKSPSTAGRDPT